MTPRLIANLIICICTGFGFIYGLLHCFGKEKPLFLKGVISAMGCMMSGRLFSVVLQLCGGESVTRMNLGYLGVAGCFLFLLSANHGEIPNHIGEKPKKSVYGVGLLAPVPVLFLIFMIFRSDASIQYKVLGLIVAFIVLHNTMHLFRYMISPDSGDGFLKMLRPYCLCALVFCYSQLGEIYFSIIENTVMLIVTYILLCLCSLVTVPLLDRRIVKWSQKEVA